MKNADNPIRDDDPLEDWLEYQNQIVDQLNNLYLARYLAPDKIRRMCKRAETACRRKKDKKIFLMIRKHSNPCQLLDDCYHDLMAVFDVVVGGDVA